MNQSELAKAPIWQDYQFKMDYFNNHKKVKKIKKQSKSRKKYGS